MKTRDTQYGEPYVTLKDTKSNIEAMSVESGSVAFATDTLELGYYTGSAWVWNAGASGGGGGDRIIGLATAGLTSTWKATASVTWQKISPISGSNLIGSYWDNTAKRFTPPAGICHMTGLVHINGDARDGLHVAPAVSGGVYGACNTRYTYTYNLGITPTGVNVSDGSKYYEWYCYFGNISRSNYIRNDLTKFYMVCYEAT